MKSVFTTIDEKIKTLFEMIAEHKASDERIAELSGNMARISVKDYINDKETAEYENMQEEWLELFNKKGKLKKSIIKGVRSLAEGLDLEIKPSANTLDDFKSMLWYMRNRWEMAKETMFGSVWYGKAVPKNRLEQNANVDWMV